jgi:Peptidase family M23
MKNQQVRLVALITTIYVTLPSLWLAAVVWFPFDNSIFAFINGAVAYALTIAFVIVGAWNIFGYGLRVGLIIAALVSFPIWVTRVISLPIFSHSSLTAWLFTIISIVLGALIIPTIRQALIPYPKGIEAVNLGFPFGHGVYYVHQGGASEVLNYHMAHKPIRYAIDFNKLGMLGWRAFGLLPSDPKQYAVFGDLLYSPCAGVVTSARGDMPDFNPPNNDPSYPLGNHVILHVPDQNIKVVLAHLQHDSVLVSVGDQVQQGQVLARIGNSGNTSEPHLHIHVERGGNPDDYGSGEGVPMRFDGRLLSRNDLIYRNRSSAA